MSIRHTLNIFTLLLGGAILVAVAVQIASQLASYRAALSLAASNSIREQLLVSGDALSAERRATIALLTTDRRATDGQVRELRRAVDEALLQTRRTILERQDELSNGRVSLDLLADVQRGVRELRWAADAAVIAGGEAPLRAAARWLGDVTGHLESLRSTRLALLRSDEPRDRVIRAEGRIRNYASVVQEAVARNQALAQQAVLDDSVAGGELMRTLAYNTGRAAVAWQLIETDFMAGLPPNIVNTIDGVRGQYRDRYLPAEQNLVRFVGTDEFDTAIEEFDRTAMEMIGVISSAQRQLLENSRAAVGSELDRAALSLAIWTLLLFLAGVIVVLSLLVVRQRVVEPLEQLRTAMLKLAENDLSTRVPRVERSDEIGRMANTLRQFKANAIRRERIERDKQALHARLEDAYHQLRQDLNAAAAIQEAMLPKAAPHGPIRHLGLYRPSSIIAGDTYNVLQRRDGQFGFFQVDVAGHGAAAALVSVACQHILSQAYLTGGQGTRLDEIVTQMNADWPEELPYFTMIFGEVDTNLGKMRIVQAGHPSPLLLRSDGSVVAVGNGGFPVGLVRSVGYETSAVEFGSGDRLIVYSDGLTEMANRTGDQYSEERLRNFINDRTELSSEALLNELNAELRSWRATDVLDDDLTVLVLERERLAGHDHS